MTSVTNHSFVVCAYGDSPYLGECIASLKQQTYSSEILLYTSTPSRYIEDLCKQYHIPYYTATGGSIGKDWNAALSFVTTPYVTIAHQDDYYEPDYAQKIMVKMSPKTLIAYSDYYEFKNNQKVTVNTNLKIKRLMLGTLAVFPSWKWWRRRVLSLGNPISCPAVTYNLEKLSDFQFDPEMKVSIDWFAWAEIAKKKGRFDYVPEQLMFHRIHEDSETSNTIKDNTRTKEDLFMYEQFWPKPIAKWISNYYEKSQQSNTTDTKEGKFF